MNVMYDAIYQRKQVLYTRSHTTGFTIVELLVVIVIIAILAAITIVAYSGIQQRAQNSAIISAAEQTYKLIEGYVSTNDAYPYTGGVACVTYKSGCTDAGGTVQPTAATFNTNVAAFGQLPTSVPTSGSVKGIYYSHTGETYNGKPQPARLSYFLFGTNQQCGLSDVATNTWPTLTTSTTGYTNGNINNENKALCWAVIPGPSA